MEPGNTARMVGTSSLPLNAAIERAAALLADDPAGAGAAAAAILARAPNDPRALLIAASSHRRLGDVRRALAILRPLAAKFPNAAHTQYELGASLADLGEAAPAMTALRRATRLNRDLAEAWRGLGDLLFARGDARGADAAFAEHARASVKDPALRPAADAIFEGRLAAAEQMLRDQVTRRPTDAAAMRMLAELFNRQGRHPDAEVLLARSLELEPGHAGSRFLYAEALFHQQKAAEAIVLVEGLLKTSPKDPAYRNMLAACLGLVGDDARLGAIYEGLLADYPDQPKIWLNYAHALRAVGRRDDAIAAFRRCIALDPGVGDAYWGLANLKVAVFSEAETTAMAAALARPDLAAPNLAGEDRLHLHYALGKALEDRGDDAGAFDHYAKGAQLRRADSRYDAGETTARMKRSKSLFTQAFFEARKGTGCDSTAPIFIVGLPRSGSTLIEQILASHSAVEGTMELPDIGLIARRLGAAYPEGLADLDPGALKALGEDYLASTRIHRKLGRPMFIDKMPNNFQHVGLIHLILPKARIIDARRHPMATCFSAFKQHFAQGQSFSYDLTDLGHYYRDYVEVMDHFDAVLPGRIRRVIYEDMVEATEGEVRRLLAYCGLPFEEACLKFYENDRAVRTVSSEQVRRPIFRDGLEQWRRFEGPLAPLKAALGPSLAAWRGAARGDSAR